MRSFRGGCVGIILLTIAVYLPALRGGFIWDDDDHLTENPAVNSPSGLRQIWTSLKFARYYPLTLTTFWAQCRIWGLNPLLYHGVNIALHAGNAVLLFLLLRRLNVHGAWVASALWAVHPVCVESVAWITELKNTQSCLLFFLALLSYLRFEERTGKSSHWLLLSLVLFTTALLSKPSTVILPLVLLLIAWWRRKKWHRLDFLRFAPFFVLAAGMSLLTILEQQRMIVHEPSASVLSWPSRFALAGQALWFYAGKLLWPFNLAFVYPRWSIENGQLTTWLPLAAAVIVGTALWRYRRYDGARVTLFGTAFFAIALAPVLGFFDLYYFRYSFVADHFQYLAAPGLIVLATVGARKLLHRRPVRIVGSTLAIAGLSALTWHRIPVFHDEESLWRDTVAKNASSSMAHNNLAMTLRNQDRWEEAITQYQIGLHLDPVDAIAHNNLGEVYVIRDRYEEAVAHLGEAIRLMPDFPEAQANLGIALAGLGRIGEASQHFAEAVRQQPDSPGTYINWGVALLNAGRLNDAAERFQKAIDLAETRQNLQLAAIARNQLQRCLPSTR